MYEKIMEGDDQLYKLGYRESRRKPGLYYKSRKSYRAFLDHRNIGGHPVAEQVRRGPMFYAQVLEEDKGYGSGLNLGIIREQRRLVKAGIKYRISIISGSIPAGELTFGTAQCTVCGKTLVGFGPTCDDTCQEVYRINKTARDEGAPLFQSIKDAQPSSDGLSEGEAFIIGLLCGGMTDEEAKKTFRVAEQAKQEGDCPICAIEKHHGAYMDHNH